MIDKILNDDEARNLFNAHCFYTTKTHDAVTEDCLCDLFGREIAVYIRNLRYQKDGLRNFNHSIISHADVLAKIPGSPTLPDPFGMWGNEERTSVLIYDRTCFSIAVSLHNKRLLLEKYHKGEIV